MRSLMERTKRTQDPQRIEPIQGGLVVAEYNDRLREISVRLRRLDEAVDMVQQMVAHLHGRIEVLEDRKKK